MVKAYSALQLFLKKKQEEGFYSHYFLSYGSLQKGAPPTTEHQDSFSEDVFDLASLTKAVVTTPLVLHSLSKMTEPEALGLSFGHWLGKSSGLFHPKIQNLALTKILQHSAGLPHWKNMWTLSHPSKGLERPLNRFSLVEKVNYYVGSSRALKEPLYSDIGFILLGLGLELRSGLGLGQLFENYYKKTLSLKSLNLFFKPSKELKERVVPTGYCSVRQRVLRGEVHDENCAAIGGEAGHAGLFGTGQSLVEFLRAFVLTKEAARLFNWSERLGPYGWRPGNSSSTAVFAGGRSLGHFGFTGCAFWVDPVSWDFLVFLTNRVQHSRVTPEFNAIRKEVFVKITESLSRR